MNPINQHKRFKIGLAAVVVGLSAMAGAFRAEAQGATVTACKFYDLNLNGGIDAGEVAIPGFKFVLTPAVCTNAGQRLTAFTGSNGNLNGYAVFTNVPPGDYILTEVLPNISWVPTLGVSQPVTVVAGTQTNLCFGNVCVGTNGTNVAVPPIYFAGPAGEAELTAKDTNGNCILCDLLDPTSIDYLVGNPPVLVDGVLGGIFDPLSYSDLQAWIRAANSVNLAYCLSVEVAGVQLNSLTGRVSLDEIIYAPGLPGDLVTYLDPGNLFAVLGEVLAGAQNLLGLELVESAGLGVVSPRDEDAGVFLAFKRALGDANRNRNYLQSQPCPFSYGQKLPTPVCPPFVPVGPVPVVVAPAVKAPVATTAKVTAHRASEMASPR